MRDGVSLPVGLGRALRRRCPACGWGPLFRGWFRPVPACERCGLLPDRGEDDYFLGALVLNFMVTELAIAGLVFLGVWATWPGTPWTVVIGLGLVAAVGVPIVAYPVARTVWLALDLQFRPPVRQGDPRPPFGVS